MTVNELIERLKEFDGDCRVVYYNELSFNLHSEVTIAMPKQIWFKNESGESQPHDCVFLD